MAKKETKNIEDDASVNKKESKSTKASKESKPKKTTKKASKKKSVDSTDDSGIVLIDDNLEVDTEKELEERKAYLEEARSQDSGD